MNKAECMKIWKHEENQSFKGWDFSYISKRYTEEALPWDYTGTVKALMGNKKMLDMGTGGGEFLLSLQPEAGITFATESYPPNIELCKMVLPGHGIEISAVDNDEMLPFENNFFDLIINRHESFCAKEVHRILNQGGKFVTQQVGGKNNKELSKLLLGEYPSIIDMNFNLENTVKELTEAGFKVINQHEFFPRIRFYDIGALVFFARIIEWEFPDFSVQRCFYQLFELQQKLEKDGYVESIGHRFFIEAIKE